MKALALAMDVEMKTEVIDVDLWEIGRRAASATPHHNLLIQAARHELNINVVDLTHDASPFSGTASWPGWRPELPRKSP